jgi:hypothetical protein
LSNVSINSLNSATKSSLDVYATQSSKESRLPAKCQGCLAKWRDEHQSNKARQAIRELARRGMLWRRDALPVHSPHRIKRVENGKPANGNPRNGLFGKPFQLLRRRIGPEKPFKRPSLSESINQKYDFSSLCGTPSPFA